LALFGAGSAGELLPGCFVFALPMLGNSENTYYLAATVAHRHRWRSKLVVIKVEDLRLPVKLTAYSEGKIALPSPSSHLEVTVSVTLHASYEATKREAVTMSQQSTMVHPLPKPLPRESHHAAS
jgi:hypothetical protein